MSLEYSFTSSDGSEGKIDATTLQNHMIEAGIQVSISPDGTTATMMHNGQELEGPVSALIEQKYGRVGSITPGADATDYSTVDNMLKSGIAQFGSDSLKAKYLQLAMQNSGFEDPKIVGSGDDWFRYDPASQQYLALTNRPGAEFSDALTYLPQAARTVGNITGGVAGGASGLLAGGLPAIAVGAAGSAIGGQVGARGAELIQSIIDPNFAQTLGNMTSEENFSKAGDVATEMGTDAILGAIPAIALKPLQTFFQKGLVTRAATGAARGVEAGGKAVEQLARLAGNSELARGIGTQLASPTLGTAQAAGWLAQAPQFLTTKGLGLAEKALSKMGFPNAARLFEDLGTGRGALDSAEAGLNAYKAIFKDPGVTTPLRTQARDVLGNLGERIGNRTIGRGMKNADARGLVGQELAEETSRLGRQAQNFATAGETVGRVFDATATLGRGVERGVDTVAKGVLKGAQYGGAAASAVGRAGRFAGDIARPLEGRALLQGARYYGEENLPWRKK